MADTVQATLVSRRMPQLQGHVNMTGHVCRAPSTQKISWELFLMIMRYIFLALLIFLSHDNRRIKRGAY